LLGDYEVLKYVQDNAAEILISSEKILYGSLFHDLTKSTLNSPRVARNNRFDKSLSCMNVGAVRPGAGLNLSIYYVEKIPALDTATLLHINFGRKKKAQ
jgi:hypothetical protein